MNVDPIRELEEVYLEAEHLEQNVRRSVEIGAFMLEKNKELIK